MDDSQKINDFTEINEPPETEGPAAGPVQPAEPDFDVVPEDADPEPEEAPLQDEAEDAAVQPEEPDEGPAPEEPDVLEDPEEQPSMPDPEPEPGKVRQAFPDEISVLDYVKFKLNPKNFGKEILPAENPVSAQATENTAGTLSGLGSFLERKLSGYEFVKTRLNPVFLGLSLCIALAAQYFLEPSAILGSRRSPWVGEALYFLAAVCFFGSFFLRKKDTDSTALTASEKGLFEDEVRYEFLSASLVSAVFAFLLFGGNQFTFLNLTVWGLSLIFGVLAFSRYSLAELFIRVRDRIRELSERKFVSSFRFSLWNLLWLAVFLCCAFFLFHDLDGVPVDMVSDHAEKLYDIKDIMDGKRPIFFTRNTGRECFQFYFTLLVIKLFGTGLTFLSLKIGTALAGLFILPFVYKLGKMLWNRRIGLLAMLFCGISYWPVVIQRAGLRFAYYPMFTAPALYFLIKGLRNRDRGAMIWSGIFLGLGLHGYSPFRIVPVAFVVIFLIYLLMDVKSGAKTNAMGAFFCLILFAFLVFLPLARVTMDMPQMVVYRSISRIGESERSFDNSPLAIFADNVRKGIVMPFWDDGSTWVHSIVYRPALEHFSASFFFIGLLFVLLRIFRERKWEDICILLSIPLFMLPSTLSLAFPAENPCLNRTAGALIPVFLVAAAGFCCCFDVFMRALRKNAVLFPVFVFLSSAVLGSILANNYDLIFRRYAYEYNRSAWNTKQIGTVIKGFAESIGEYENAYVIPYPHWVDTRLVGINAGDPGKD
ncbi:MAG: glycosyltransferase family 39 protein, partial [Anaerolineaceae bacterium]|nr:glycosyltransferase family 39 protein [Anaerolineaceae bacterium]